MLRNLLFLVVALMACYVVFGYLFVFTRMALYIALLSTALIVGFMVGRRV